MSLRTPACVVLPATAFHVGPAVPTSLVPGIPDPGELVLAGVHALLGSLTRSVFADVIGPLARYLLHTPDLLAQPTLTRLWEVSFGCLLALAALLVAGSGVAFSTGGRWGLAAREAVGSRLVAGLLSAALALPLVAGEARLANTVVDAIVSTGITRGAPPGSDPVGVVLANLLNPLPNPGDDLALLAAAAVLAALAVALTVAGLLRWASLWLLIVCGPLAMAVGLLPGGAGTVRAWWRLQAVAVFLPIAHAVLVAADLALFSSASTGLIGALSGIALLTLMVKLPGWLLGATGSGDHRDVLLAVRRGRGVTTRLLTAVPGPGRAVAGSTSALPRPVSDPAG